MDAVLEMERRLRRAERWERRNAAGTGLDRYRSDPAYLLADAGLPPDPWQAEVLRGAAARSLLLCSRQVGKSTVAAAVALRAALLTPASLVLLVSPSLRQSGELFRDKVMTLYERLGCPVAARRRTALTLELANGSRVVSVPAKEATIRGYSGVRLVIIDEASRIPDALYFAMRPTLAASNGHLVALSTPFGKRGWFFSEWDGPAVWARVRVTAPECPRIAAEFLAEEEQSLGARWYRQEYLCSFEDQIDAVFFGDDIKAAFQCGAEPLWGTKA